MATNSTILPSNGPPISSACSICVVIWDHQRKGTQQSLVLDLKELLRSPTGEPLQNPISIRDAFPFPNMTGTDHRCLVARPPEQTLFCGPIRMGLADKHAIFVPALDPIHHLSSIASTSNASSADLAFAFRQASQDGRPFRVQLWQSFPFLATGLGGEGLPSTSMVSLKPPWTDPTDSKSDSTADSLMAIGLGAST